MEYMDVLQRVPLFAGFSPEELPNTLQCLEAQQKKYQKDETIFLAGDAANRVGILLCGTAQVVSDDVFGNRSIRTMLGEADLFGEVFACAEVEQLPVSVIAQRDCVVLLINYARILSPCQAQCIFHANLVENMMRILAQKNLMLSTKMDVLSARSTRHKLLNYFSALAMQQGSAQVTLPFDRQQLADYLAVDRSAMSTELSKMQRDGLIRYQKNRIELLGV
ncbi:Crp/Fnr family transcriptional regulator [Eubacteriales bacterium OttesenSCG-928-N14]|nr:Crp/Fnr family transcriptional regulator [Eubacteriales bacterium OttesenSCG-928-N14]